MAGLNNIISNPAQQQTTLPSWFDTAQQNVVSGAQQAFGAAPAPGQTVAQNAINTLAGPTNPFTQATGTLRNIATGAANPWIVDQTAGTVTPNINTPLGGLFQAQNQQLQQLMPNVTAPVTGATIGTGQFGSLRGKTAVNKAMADAQAQLFSEQMKAALQNQQTGVQAGLGAGNLTQQEINNLLTVGQYQQAAPFTNVSNLGKVIGGIQAPTTVTNQTQLSPLNQILGIATALGGTTGNTGLLKQLGVTGGLPGLIGGAKDLLANATRARYSGQTGVPAGPDAPAEVQDAFGKVKEGYFQDEVGNWYGPNSYIPIAGPDSGVAGGGIFDYDFGGGSSGLDLSDAAGDPLSGLYLGSQEFDIGNISNFGNPAFESLFV